MVRKLLSVNLWLVLTASMLATTNLSADVCRSVDADGNVTYSDTAHAGAKKVEVLQPTIIPSMRTTKKIAPGQTKNDSLDYTSVKIVAPAPEANLRNIESVSVRAQTTPRLQTRLGHRASFLFDGSAIREPSTALNATIEQVERGAHTIQLVIIDKSGKTVAQSAVSQFFVHKTSVLNRPAPKIQRAPSN